MSDAAPSHKIGVLSDAWAAKTIVRKLDKLELDSVVIQPDKNVRIPAGLALVLYIPKAISHGARDRAREWSAATGRPVVALAQNCHLMPELRKAGVLPETPMSIPANPPSCSLSPEVQACRLAQYGTAAAWFRAIFRQDPHISHNRCAEHPDWNGQRHKSLFSQARVLHRRELGLVPWSVATDGISFRDRRDLPISLGPLKKHRAEAVSEDAQPEPETPQEAPQDFPVVVTGIAALDPPRTPEKRLSEIEGEIRAAAGMLREVARRYGIKRICIEAWGPTTVSDRPSLDTPDESPVVFPDPTTL